ncbi:MAG: hypothetical protein EPN91_04810 [Salinibacterium sp.]|nr:MAG: hypothetical protein EPN91_04810 [Salinibacterium sp.]
MLHPRSLALVLLFASAATLTGCTAAPTPEPTVTGAPPVSTTTATPSPSASADGIPVTITCDELVSPQTMYDYNPNFGLVDNYVPAAGSKAAEIVALKGLACRWVNQSSNETIDVSVANLPHDHLESLANALVESSNAVPTYGVEGYFETNGPIGEANAFSDPFWIVASSTTFSEPGDAQPIVEAAIAGLH